MSTSSGKARCMEGAASSTAREEGFITTIRSKFPGFTVLSDNQYAGAMTESAYRTCETLLNRFSDVEAIFTPNESSTACLRKQPFENHIDTGVHMVTKENIREPAIQELLHHTVKFEN